MPETKKYYHNLDVDNNKVINPLLNPLTTVQRTAVGTLLGLLDEGYVCFDTTLNQQYFWDGAAWINTGGGSQNLQQVVNIGNGISNFGGIGNASIQSTNFTNGRTLYLNDNAYPTIRLVDNANASNFLQIDLDTLNIDGVSYNWSSIVNPPTSPLVALPFTTDHITANGNPYVIGDIVYYLGNVYRCIAGNDSILPTNALYWTSLGTGFPLVQQPSDWNSTSGNNQILNKPTIPAAQIQSDWTQSNNAALDFIKNKPTIPAAQVNSDWNAVSGLAEILNKPSIPTVGTWGALNYPTWVSGTPFVKMTAVGTFALDTNTYLTSAVTSVGATSPITSSGGNTPTISTSMATNKLIGRSTAGVGVMEEITVGTGLSLSGGTLNATAQSVGFEMNFLLMGA
jgi:hypothetical protein